MVSHKESDSSTCRMAESCGEEWHEPADNFSYPSEDEHETVEYLHNILFSLIITQISLRNYFQGAFYLRSVKADSSFRLLL